MNIIQTIATKINENKIGLFPCDTLWGIIGAMNENVASYICSAKKRPIESGFIVLIPDLSYLDSLCKTIPKNAETLISQYWPGPLTLILEKNKSIDGIITGNRPTIAIRLPKDGPIRNLLDHTQQPLISTSANISTKTTIQTPEELDLELLERLDFVYDKEKPGDNIASTIVDCSGTTNIVVRKGSLTPSMRIR